MRDSELFATRAAECHEQAEAASLANVRERCLRAEAAWTAMAQRSQRTESARDAREASAETARQAAIDCNREDFILTVTDPDDEPTAAKIAPELRPAIPLR